LVSMIVLILLVGGMSCGTISFGKISTGTVTNTTSIPDNYEATHQDVSWVSPGKVEVGNFKPGDHAEWAIKIHNGNEYTTEQIQVTTETEETAGDIPLHNSIIGDIQLKSNNPNDSLILMGSHDNIIAVSGFNPADTRIMSITYKCKTLFDITLEQPTRTPEGYGTIQHEILKGWVVIADLAPVLMPFETRDILITLNIPSDIGDVVIPDKWEFWVEAHTSSQSGSVEVRDGGRCRWQVNMRT
jgi:hypothetical protein